VRGYFGIGVYCPKSEINYGTLFRSANVFGASFVFLIGRRFKKLPSDTLRTERHIPLTEYRDFGDFYDHRPVGCSIVGVEMGKDFTRLAEFKHPNSAVYLLGAEDTGLPRHVMTCCDCLVSIPGENSLNVSVAGSIVMYDRIAKAPTE
jgi:tRNA G18 (ribose-2'-O)-methylase SpoU